MLKIFIAAAHGLSLVHVLNGDLVIVSCMDLYLFGRVIYANTTLIHVSILLASYLRSGIEDILNRLKTLEDANLDLQNQVEGNDKNMDGIRNELQVFRLETQNQVLVQNSHVHKYQNELERLKATSKMGRDDEEARQVRDNDVNRENGQIIMAIRNLYTRCTNTHKSKKKPFHNNWVNNAKKVRVRRRGAKATMRCEYHCVFEKLVS